MGREALLVHLHELLQAGGAVALHGLPGVGKTQTALAYAMRHRAEYRAVFWMRAATREELITGFSELATLLDLPEKAAVEQEISVAVARRWLAQETGWLLIFDNADDLKLAQTFLPADKMGRLLLTTRDPATRALAEPVAVDCLSPEVSALFLLRRAGRLAKDATLADATPLDQTIAQTLGGELGGLPLALDQAGAYLDEIQISVEEYLKRYREAGHALRARRGELADHDSVAATFALAFAQVANSDPVAADLLRLCAFLDGSGIPEEIFGKSMAELKQKLDQHNWWRWFFSMILGRWIRRERAIQQPKDLHQMVRAASRLSLLHRDRDNRLLVIHPVVQDALRDELDDKARVDWINLAIHLVNDSFPEVRFEHWPRCERLLPQVLACDRWIASQDFPPVVVAARLLNQTGYYLRTRARYEEAGPLLKRALAINERLLGPTHINTATSLNNLAGLYWYQGRLDEAEPLYQRALKIRKRALGPEHPDTASSLNNLAELYQDQGRLDEAESLLQNALAITEQKLGLKHPDTAQSLNNLASLYHDQGRHTDAKLLYQRALTIRKQTLGLEHPDTAQTLNDLALLYHDQGRLDEAEPLFDHALAIRERALGLEHPDTAGSLNNLADLYRAQGRLAEAEPLCQLALVTREHALGQDHPHTATSLNNLASLYRDQGRLDEAEPLFERALAIFEKALGPAHPHTHAVRDNLTALKERRQS